MCKIQSCLQLRAFIGLEILGPLWIRGNCYSAWYTLSPMILKFRSSPILHMRKLENRWGTANCQGPQWSNIIDRWTDRQGGFKLALPTPEATFHLPNHVAPCQDNKLTSNCGMTCWKKRLLPTQKITEQYKMLALEVTLKDILAKFLHFPDE